MSAKSKSPRPTQDMTDTVSEESLRAARVRWGLDAAPTLKGRPAVTVPDAVKRRGARMARAAGTPLDVVRALLAVPIPEEWERDLREMSPKTDAHSWLMLAWKEPLFQPQARRLVVYECIPEAHIHPEYLLMLQENPYWELPQDQRAGRAQLVSAFQWEMYRRHKVKAVPFWIVQGTEGGTPASYTEQERKWLRAMKQPDSPPPLGTLPYAPWDNRVKAAIRERDRLWKFGGNLERLRARGNTATIQAELDAAEREHRQKFWAWWSDKMQENADIWRWYTNHTEVTHRLRRESREEFLAAATAEERFIETGKV